MTGKRKARGTSSPHLLPRRISAEEVPDGITLEEAQAVAGGPFESVRLGTRDVYTKHASYFASWRAPRAVGLSDVSTYHLKVYLAEMVEGLGRSPSWVGCAIAAVKRVLAWEGRLEQVDWEDVADQARGYRRDYPYSPAGVDGITADLFETIRLFAPLPAEGEWPEKAARRAAFDLALISLKRDCLLRREETAAATWGDITIQRKGGKVHGALTIPFSKTDRTGQGEVGYVSIDTLALLQEMAAICGRDPTRKNEPIFGIGGKQVANRLAAACRHAGIDGRFAGHSARVGMAMDLAMHDASLAAIMQAGRWRVPSTVIRYIRRIAVADGPVAKVHEIWDRERVADPSEAAG